MSTLENRTVLITGATRGIGRSLAIRLAKDGCRLAICGRDARLLTEVEKAAESAGAAKVFATAFDLQGQEKIRSFIESAREAVGPIDVLVNNAGFNPRKAKLVDVSTDEFDSIISVNLRAPFLLMREVYPDMKAAGGGHVVNVLSTVCHASMETMGAYTAAKDGFQALTSIFRKEVLDDNIRVTAIYPGGTDTDFRPNDRPDYMHPDSVASVIHSILTMPEDVVTHEFTFRPMVERNF